MARPRTNRTSAHSVRTTDDLWARAKKRAEGEGVTLNHVMNEILEGYARGMINLPKVVKQYQVPSSSAPVSADGKS